MLNPVIWSYIVGCAIALAGGVICYLGYFAYKKISAKKTAEINIMIEKKRDSISQLCEEAHRLLSRD